MDQKNEMFTDEEKVILDALQKEYKWIARDKDGALGVYKERPKKLQLYHIVDDETRFSAFIDLEAFVNIFKGVTWENSPICFRPPILDKVERRYLKTVFRPFHNRIKYVEKLSPYAVKEKCYIWACVGEDDSLELPLFDKRKMYKGMESNECYTLEELGITYD